MGMTMPGWYDIVRPRNAVRALITLSCVKSSINSLSNATSRQTSTTWLPTKIKSESSAPKLTFTHSSHPKSRLVSPPIVSSWVVSPKEVPYQCKHFQIPTLDSFFFPQNLISRFSFSGITAPQKLGGIFGLSCYLLLQSKLQEFIPAESPNSGTPIYMGHGDSE